MAKFSSKEKIQAVKRYLDGTESGKIIAKSIGVNPSVLREWIRRYESSGEKAFEKCYTFYPAQYKLDVLYYMNEHGTSIRETAALFNIPSYETLRKWKIAYETGGLDALQSKKKGRPTMKDKKIKPVDEGSIEALQAENERLRMENAYLKKLNALVQNKEKSPNKTKRK
ncbi:transposase [Bacillus thuringiensis]|nr:Mobile element protein [Bacillus cereus]EDZ50238.1 transposase [Bacillus cereus AH1134]MBG9465198.1 transposase [Bacillus thuringiensis]EDZ54447.1 transposase [Bacillus cereus AH1134]KGT44227.1 transposase [Bacillus cereus]